MEWLLIHGLEWVPGPLRVPVFLAAGAISLYIGWHTPASVAPLRRFGFFAVASAAYFACFSPGLNGGNHVAAPQDPAHTAAIVLAAVALALFLLSASREERKVAVRLAGLRLAGQDES